MSPLTPDEAGQRVAALFERAAPRLFADLVESGAIPGSGEANARARVEWECYALFGCVRGIVAAGGFAPKTAETIDALHNSVMRDGAGAQTADTSVARRALLGRRYEEYETIAQTGGAAGAADAALRLGTEAARRMFAGSSPPDDLAGILGSMHEILAESVVSLLSGESELPDD